MRHAPLRREFDALLAEYRRDVPQKLALAGSAGTFGLHLISCGTNLDDARRAELERLLGVLRHEACIT